MKKGVKKQLITRIFMIIIFLLGCLTALYPFYSDAINGILDQRMMEKFERERAIQEAERREQMLEENERIAKNGASPGADPFGGESGKKNTTQSYLEKHMIGTLTIPKINAQMPIFDTTNDRLLDRGATVLQGTSYPTGGPSTHSVLTAHRGLPQRQLFTDLPKLQKEDLFILEILGEKLAYEVNQIKTVEPNQTEDLRIFEGEDLVTLVTCTPYMINSHRLLVRGHRVPYTEEIAKASEAAKEKREWMQWLILAGMILLILFLLYLLYRSLQIYRLRKKVFDLTFYLRDAHDRPLSGITMELLDRKGKLPKQRNGRKMQATSDGQGKIIFEKLPGNLYMVKPLGNSTVPAFRIGLTKPKQTELQVLLPKNAEIEQIKQDQQIILRKKAD